VRVRVGGVGVGEAVAGMRGQLAGVLEHEHASLAVAQRGSGVPGGAPVFTCVFNYPHHAPPPPGGQGTDGQSADGQSADGQSVQDSARGGGIRRVYGTERSNYPLSVSVDDYGESTGVVVDAVPPADSRAVCAMLHTALAGVVGALEQQL